MLTLEKFQIHTRLLICIYKYVLFKIFIISSTLYNILEKHYLLVCASFSLLSIFYNIILILFCLISTLQSNSEIQWKVVLTIRLSQETEIPISQLIFEKNLAVFVYGQCFAVSIFLLFKLEGQKCSLKIWTHAIHEKRHSNTNLVQLV